LNYTRICTVHFKRTMVFSHGSYYYNGKTLICQEFFKKILTFNNIYKFFQIIHACIMTKHL